jgi:hypothetical protein
MRKQSGGKGDRKRDQEKNARKKRALAHTRANLKFSVCVGHSAAVLNGLEHNRKRWLQSYPRVCFAGVLCIDRFLQLCSGLEHNHQKVAADRSLL